MESDDGRSTLNNNINAGTYFVSATVAALAFVATGWLFMWHVVLKRNPIIRNIIFGEKIIRSD